MGGAMLVPQPRQGIEEGIEDLIRSIRISRQRRIHHLPFCVNLLQLLHTAITMSTPKIILVTGATGKQG